MKTIPQRELRNQISRVLRQVEAGERLRITVDGRAVADLLLGVLLADDPTTRAQRLRTLSSVEELFEPLPIDTSGARVFAELAAEARRQGKRPKIMDTWIAATAVAHDLPIYTQDDDVLAITRAHVVHV